MPLGKTVQIDTDLFLALCNHFLNDEDYTSEIQQALSDKLNKLAEREIFSQYKRAPKNSAEREYYRQKYLDQVGMTKSFRTDREISLLPPEDDPSDLL